MRACVSVYVCSLRGAEGHRRIRSPSHMNTQTHTFLSARGQVERDLCQVARVFTVTETRRPRKHNQSERGRAS